jgi:hypothetical protein
LDWQEISKNILEKAFSQSEPPFANFVMKKAENRYQYPLPSSLNYFLLVKVVKKIKNLMLIPEM